LIENNPDINRHKSCGTERRILTGGETNASRVAVLWYAFDAVYSNAAHFKETLLTEYQSENQRRLTLYVTRWQRESGKIRVILLEEFQNPISAYRVRQDVEKWGVHALASVVTGLKQLL